MTLCTSPPSSIANKSAFGEKCLFRSKVEDPVSHDKLGNFQFRDMIRGQRHRLLTLSGAIGLSRRRYKYGLIEAEIANLTHSFVNVVNSSDC